jgi:hypothetical protein
MNIPHLRRYGHITPTALKYSFAIFGYGHVTPMALRICYRHATLRIYGVLGIKQHIGNNNAQIAKTSSNARRAEMSVAPIGATKPMPVRQQCLDVPNRFHISHLRRSNIPSPYLATDMSRLRRFR